MITEQEIINDLESISKKLKLLENNRRNNSEFWKNTNSQIKSILIELNKDKRIYGW